MTQLRPRKRGCSKKRTGCVPLGEEDFLGDEKPVVPLEDFLEPGENG